MKTTNLHEIEETRGSMLVLKEIKSLLTVIAYCAVISTALIAAVALHIGA